MVFFVGAFFVGAVVAFAFVFLVRCFVVCIVCVDDDDVCLCVRFCVFINFVKFCCIFIV